MAPSRYREVLTQGTYYRTPVDDATTLINFRNQVPAALRNVSFFVATAHSAYHVFSGYGQRVIEGHAGRGPLAWDIVEAGTFQPLSPQGKPSGQDYKSGLLAIPPQPN